MADGYLNFDTKIDTNGFNKGISAIGKIVSNAGKAITKNVTKPATVAATALAGMTLAKGWSRMTALDNAKVKLQAIGNNAEDVAAIMDNALASVKGTSYGMDEAATTAASAVAAGIKPGKQLTKYLTSVADAAAVAGTDMSSMGAIFNKVATQGKANNEVLQQMAEAGIPIYQYLAEEIGCTAGEVFDMASQGEIDLATFQKSVETHIGGAAKTIGSSTITGAISNLMASISRIGANFLGSADDADSFAGQVLPMLNSLTGALEVVEDKASELGKKFGEAFAPIAETVKNACDSFTEMDEASQNSALKSIATGAAIVVGFGPGLQMFGKIVQGSDKVQKTVGAIPGIFKNTGKSVKESTKNMGSAVDGLKTGVAEMWLSMKDKDAASVMGASLKDGASTTRKSLGDMLSAAKPFASMFVSSLGFAAIAGAIVAGLGLVQSQFGDQIDSLLQTVTEKGPKVITDFCDGITSKLPELIAQGSTLIQNLLSAITANIPAIITGGIQIISGLITGIAQQLPALIPAALQMILTIIQSLLQNIPQLINAGLQLIIGLAQGLINAVPMLISAVPQIIQTLVSGIAQSLPTIILAGIQLIVALITGIIQAIPDLLAMVPQIFGAFIDGIMSVDWASVGEQILTSIIDGIKSIGSNLWDAVKGIFEDGEEEAGESGKNTGQQYAQGIESTTADAQTAAYDIATVTTDSFASTLDANGETINLAAMNMGNNASMGLDLANVPGAFQEDAQAAVNGLTSTLDMNAFSASLSGQIVGQSANAGVASADMSGNFSIAGTEAGQALGASLTGQTDTVAFAADQVSNSASNVDLNNAYANAGTQAMQSLAGSIASSDGTVNSAGKSAGTAAITGLVSAKMPEKAKKEGTNFIKFLVNAIRAGAGTTRLAVNTVMNAAKSAARGLGNAGYSAGRMFSTGLANGILSGQSNISMAAAQVANAAVRTAQQNLDINSPSKVGIWIGEMFDTGIAEGLVNHIKRIANGVGKVTNTIGEGTQSALSSLQRQAITAPSILNDRNYTATGSTARQALAGTQAQQMYVQTKATLTLQDGRVIAEVTTPYVDANIGNSIDKKGRHMK